MPIRIDGDKVTEEIKNMNYINWIQILTLKHQIPLSLWGEIVGLKLELSVKTLAGYEKRERVPTKKYLQNSVSMIRMTTEHR